MGDRSHSRPFDYDPFTGVKSTFHWDAAEGKFYINEEQDVQPLIEVAKSSYNNFDERARWGDDLFHHVASIPPVVYADLQKKGILDDPKLFKAWLNDRDNRAFRTRPGRI